MNNNSGNNLGDRDIIDKVLGGDPHAFGSIVRNTEKLVAHIVFKMIANTGDRKDIAQDIYLKVYKKLPGFQYQSKLSTWIARIGYNTCLDYLRKKRPELYSGLYDESGIAAKTSTLVNNKSPGNRADGFMLQKDLAGILQVEIEKLPPVYQTLITLYHLEELSYDEIGQITGLPSGTVKSYLFRARRSLKENLLLQYKKEDL